MFFNVVRRVTVRRTGQKSGENRRQRGVRCNIVSGDGNFFFFLGSSEFEIRSTYGSEQNVVSKSPGQRGKNCAFALEENSKKMQITSPSTTELLFIYLFLFSTTVSLELRNVKTLICVDTVAGLTKHVKKIIIRCFVCVHLKV